MIFDIKIDIECKTGDKFNTDCRIGKNFKKLHVKNRPYFALKSAK